MPHVNKSHRAAVKIKPEVRISGAAQSAELDGCHMERQ